MAHKAIQAGDSYLFYGSDGSTPRRVLVNSDKKTFNTTV